MKGIHCGVKFLWAGNGDRGVTEELDQTGLGFCKNKQTKKKEYICALTLTSLRNKSVFLLMSVNTSHLMPACHHINQLENSCSRQIKLAFRFLVTLKLI